MGIRSVVHRLRDVCAKVVRSDAVEALPHGGGRCQVLFVNGCDLEAMRRYRVEHQREQLELWDVSTDEVFYTAVRESDAERAEVLVVYRCPITEGVRALIRRAHDLGKKVYFDVDDLVIDTRYTDGLPAVRDMEPEEKALFDDGVVRNGETLRLCDGAIVSTDCLATELSSYLEGTGTILVNRNVASQDMVDRARRVLEASRPHDPNRVVMGYFSGSMTHNADFNEILPALTRVLEQRSNAFLKVVGDLELPDLLRPHADRVLHAARVSWERLPELIASVDINLAPLEPTLFNEAKSENKWTEAALVKVPTVASDVGAFAQMICHGRTGLLCSSDGAWERCLLALVDDEDLRRRLGEQAHAYCLTNCVTAQTGFSLAHFLCGTPADAGSIVPQEEPARRDRIRGFLQSRGFQQISGAFSNEPWEGVSLDERLRRIEDGRRQGRRTALFVYERTCGDTPTFRYFGYNVVQRLAHSDRWAATYVFVDELCEVARTCDHVDASALVRCRIRPELLSYCDEAKRCGTHLAYLIDDDALGDEAAREIVERMASDPHDKFEHDFWYGTVRRFELAASMCDAFIAPHRFLADMLSERCGAPAGVIHSSLNDEQVELATEIKKGRARNVDPRFLVGYFSGTKSHQEDFALVERSIVEFLRRHDGVALVLGGQLELGDELLGLMRQRKVIVLPFVDYLTLQYVQAAVDVILAPLVISQFSNCKSALKVFEAGAVGVPACASPSFSYAEAIEQEGSGYLCAGGEEWLAALEGLCSDADLRERMSARARTVALDRYYGPRIQGEAEKALDFVCDVPLRPIPDSTRRALAGVEVVDWDDTFESSPPFARLSQGQES